MKSSPDIYAEKVSDRMWRLVHSVTGLEIATVVLERYGWVGYINPKLFAELMNFTTSVALHPVAAMSAVLANNEHAASEIAGELRSWHAGIVVCDKPEPIVDVEVELVEDVPVELVPYWRDAA